MGKKHSKCYPRFRFAKDRSIVLLVPPLQDLELVQCQLGEILVDKLCVIQIGETLIYELMHCDLLESAQLKIWDRKSLTEVINLVIENRCNASPISKSLDESRLSLTGAHIDFLPILIIKIRPAGLVLVDHFIGVASSEEQCRELAFLDGIEQLVEVSPPIFGKLGRRRHRVESGIVT